MEIRITKRYPLKIIHNNIFFYQLVFCLLMVIISSCTQMPSGVPKDAKTSGDAYELHDSDENGNLRMRLWNSSGVLVERWTFYTDKTQIERFDQNSGQLLKTEQVQNYNSEQDVR